MRKKATILSVLLVLALVLVFTACGHDASPSEVVKQDLDKEVAIVQTGCKGCFAGRIPSAGDM